MARVRKSVGDLLNERKFSFGPKKPEKAESDSDKFYEGKSYNIYENTYQDTTIRLQGFFNLMLKWKSSVLKLVWHDLIIFLILYTIISILYRNVFFHHPQWREGFEIVCVYASRYLIHDTFSSAKSELI